MSHLLILLIYLKFPWKNLASFVNQLKYVGYATSFSTFSKCTPKVIILYHFIIKKNKNYKKIMKGYVFLEKNMSFINYATTLEVSFAISCIFDKPIKIKSLMQ